MKAKVFISQPMKGKSDKEIREERERVIALANEKVKNRIELEFIESHFEDFDEKIHPLKFLSRSIGLLAEADAAVFCPGWQDARGCKIEHECAEKYGIRIIEL